MKVRSASAKTVAGRPESHWKAGRRKVFYALTRSAVAAKLAAALEALQRGLDPTPEEQLFGPFLERWLNDVAKHTVRLSTLESYSQQARLHIIPILGKFRLVKLSPQRLQAFCSQKLAEGLSLRTVQYLRAIIHRSLDQALRWGLIARNPADLVDPPRPRTQEIKPLTLEQTARLLETAKPGRFYALYVLAITTGLRQGELLGLKWADLDIATATLYVRQQLGRTKAEGLKLGEPKTAKGRRSVALPVVALNALREHRRAQLEERLLAGSEWKDSDLVFVNHFGGPLERQNILRRSFVPLLEKAGLPRIRFHDLRHSAATLLLSQGVSAKVIQERLGHSQISVTMDVYAYVLPNLQREAADKLDALLS
ncbi:MAG: site-specific integrase [Chloroflexi bacterium]|nr:site-specific integrase [Chloroflexota bacterium]